ncbi:hypothetical protein EV714DRAFT_176840, partial [Schizophyllum commune]
LYLSSSKASTSYCYHRCTSVVLHIVSLATSLLTCSVLTIYCIATHTLSVDVDKVAPPRPHCSRSVSSIALFRFLPSSCCFLPSTVSLLYTSRCIRCLRHCIAVYSW